MLRSHKEYQILEHAGREAEMRHIGRGKAELPREDAPKAPLAPCSMHLLLFLCLKECDLREVSSILDRGFLGSVEVS